MDSATFLDLNGTAVGDIQRLGKFLREQFHDGGTLSQNAIDEALLRLSELKLMRQYKAIVDELSKEELRRASRQARKRGTIKRLQPPADSNDPMSAADIFEHFRDVFGDLFK